MSLSLDEDEELVNLVAVERRGLVSRLLPGEDIWQALGRMGELVEEFAYKKYQWAIGVEAHAEQGVIVMEYTLIMPEDELFPPERTVH